MSTVMQHTTDLSPDIQLTDAALTHIIKFLSADPSHTGIRFFIKKTGCSGYSYQVEPVAVGAEGDIQWPISDNYQLFIDKSSYPFLKGMTVDYVKQGLNSKFAFTNPNQKGQCGCGESFTIA